MNPFQKIIGAVVLAVVIGAPIGVWQSGVISSGPPPAGTANLWVVASGAGTCARSTTPQTFVSARSCGSFNAAYQAAVAGDTILVRAGAYGSQQINHRASGEVAPVITMSPETSATVTLTGLSMGSDGGSGNQQGPGFLTINGPMSFNTLRVNWSSHIVISGMTVNDNYANNAVTAEVNSASDHITIQNSELCCVTDGKVFFTDGFGGPNAGNNSVSDITLNNDYLHGVNWSNSLAHSECIYANGIARFTLTNSRMDQCGTTGGMDVTQSGTVDAPVGPYVLQNDVWGDQINASCNIQGVFPNPTTVSYNTLLRGNCALASSTIVIGNIGQGGGCGYATGSSGHNVYSDHTCSASDTVSASLYNTGNWVSYGGNGSYPSPPVDWSTIQDFNLKPTGGSPVVGKGDPSNFPANDQAGVARTNPPDAGALQH